VSKKSPRLHALKAHEYSEYLHPPKQGRRERLRRVVRSRRFQFAIVAIILVHVWLHLANPYAAVNFVQSPFTTDIKDGRITYTQHFEPHILTDPVSDLAGYYRQGFLIAQNTFFGGARVAGNDAADVIDGIHRKRFDPSKPYLISGDQFSVLYPRNLGVFYNQLLDPNTAHSQTDWENRQRIYLQSALYAIEGLSATDTPKTTLIPIGPRTIAMTSVHPGDMGSDAVYGTLYALDRLATPQASSDGTYRTQTVDAAGRVLKEKHDKLQRMVERYVANVQAADGLVRTDVHLASARDGVSRKSSFYDNVVLWKTLVLADRLGIKSTSSSELAAMATKIKTMYWNEQAGFYNNDRYDHRFTADWLIGYVTGFFDLQNADDRLHTQRTLEYIAHHDIAEPLPLRYQLGSPKDMPLIIRLVVPSYGADAIWSYWGAQYMTLLADMSRVSGDPRYAQQAWRYVGVYNRAIVRDGGFAETFDTQGNFLRSGLFYKSIRATGWVVQYEHAVKQLPSSDARNPLKIQPDKEPGYRVPLQTPVTESL
jgi:hypothetical protein